MKPFNLKKALAGEPVITADGKRIDFIAYDPKAHPYYRVMARCENHESCFLFGENGVNSSPAHSQHDLFMASVKIEYWLNVYPGTICHRFTHKDAADSSALPSRICCVRVEWKE